MTIIEFWDELGIDKDEVSARFVGNMDLAAKCTMKYIDDNTFNELQTAMAEQNYSGIEIAAQTLKGVAGNLGFSEIQKIGQRMVDNVRANIYDSLDEDFEKLKIEQKKVCELAKQL